MPHHKRKTLGLARQILLVLALLTGTNAHAGSAPLVPVSPQKPPEFTLLNESGETAPFAAKARLTALHFWATWCVPCVEELPVLDRAAAKWKSRGLFVTAVALDGKNVAKVRDFYTKHGIKHLAVQLDPTTNAYRAFKFRGLPATVFFNAQGAEIARVDGPADWEGAEITAFLEDQLPAK